MFFSAGGHLVAMYTTCWKKSYRAQIRKERALNQKDLAEAAGTCERTISGIERCERNPSLEMVLRLSAYLGLAVEEVFKYEQQ